MNGKCFPSLEIELDAILFAVVRMADMANIEINTTNSPKDSPCL